MSDEPEGTFILRLIRRGLFFRLKSNSVRFGNWIYIDCLISVDFTKEMQLKSEEKNALIANIRSFLALICS